MSAAVDASLDPADYSPWGNYALSKAANVLFTKELQRRMTQAGVKGSAVALHPGGACGL
jgi:NAD(P)-dependent dehydrogenase (short-subunit alcohol dehydrogenase family)